MSKSEDAWRGEYRAKQAAGVEFECLSGDGRSWLQGRWEFDLEQKDYREVKAPNNPDERWRKEYRKKQADGVQYESYVPICGTWCKGMHDFRYQRECYREVKPTIPHLVERASYWAQRAAGTNEVWQVRAVRPKHVEIVRDATWWDIDADTQPDWHPENEYRVKPKNEVRYVAVLRTSKGGLFSTLSNHKESLGAFRKRLARNWTLIGDIITREIET